MNLPPVLCDAPHTYLYCNDGKKRSQAQIWKSVVISLFQIHQRFIKNDRPSLLCPHCHYALSVWKQRLR